MNSKLNLKTLIIKDNLKLDRIKTPDGHFKSTACKLFVKGQFAE